LRNADPTSLNVIPTDETPSDIDSYGPIPLPTAKTNKPYNKYPNNPINWPIPINSTTGDYGYVMNKKPLPEAIDISNTTLILIVIGMLKGHYIFSYPFL
jgi:hypothetical protein